MIMNVCKRHMDVLRFAITFWCSSRLIQAAPSLVITGPNPVVEHTDVDYTCTVVQGLEAVGCSPSFAKGAIKPSSEAHNDTAVLIMVPNVGRELNNATLTCRCSGVVPSTKIIQVLYGPDVASITPESATFIEGDPLGLDVTCKAECNPRCGFAWLGPDVNIVSRDVDTSNVLELFPATMTAQRSMHGSYKCTVHNHYDKASAGVSSKVMVTVQYPPDISMTWNATSGTLTCTATGRPAVYTFDPFVQHVANFSDHRIEVREIGQVVNGNTATMVIANASFQDTGVYTCSVSNGIKGVIKEHHLVAVKDVPVFGEMPNTYNVSKGANFTLHIRFGAIPSTKTFQILPVTSFNMSAIEVTNPEPAPAVVYMHGTSIPINGTLVEVRFPEMIEEYFQTYKLVLINEMGNNSKLISINPQGVPDKPVNFAMASLSHDRVSFTAMSGFYNGGAQTYVLEFKVASVVTTQSVVTTDNGATTDNTHSTDKADSTDNAPPTNSAASSDAPTTDNAVKNENAAVADNLLNDERTDNAPNNTSWFKASSLLVGSITNTSVQLQMTNLQPETLYVFRAYSFNMYGRSDYTDQVILRTPSERRSEGHQTGSYAAIGGIVGGIVGGVLVLLAIVVCIIVVWRLRKRKVANITPPPPIVPFSHMMISDAGDNIYQNTDLYESDAVEETDSIPPPIPEHGSFLGKRTPVPAAPSQEYENTMLLPTDSQGYLDLNKAPEVEDAYAVGVTIATSPNHLSNHTNTAQVGTGEQNYENFTSVANTVPNTFRQESEDSAYLEIDLHKTNIGNSTNNLHDEQAYMDVQTIPTVIGATRDSVPNYPAPTPWDETEPQSIYMNTDVKAS